MRLCFFVLSRCWLRLRWWLVDPWEGNRLNLLCVIMSLHLNLHLLGVFQIIDNDLSTGMGPHCDCVAISTEWNAVQRYSNLDLFDLLALHNIIEVDSVVKTHTTEEEIVDWREGNACTYGGMRVELMSKGIYWAILVILRLLLFGFSLLHDAL